MATKKVILQEIVNGVAGDSIYPKTSIDQVEGLESALDAAGSVSTISVNNGTPLTPDSNKNIDITIPAAVTESTVSGWGFTKNTGTYSKPSGGIPSTDLTSAVQTSLGKADTAIQSLTVGTTTTGAAGTGASVTNTGTATEPVLSFTIPQGEQGAQGIQGIQGPQGDPGPKGDTGVTAEASDLVIKQAIDVEETYVDTDIAGAETVKTLTKEDLSNEKVIAAALVELASKVDDGYTFKGLVTPTDGVGTQIQKAAYVGMAGVYTNFSGNTFTIPSEHIGIFLWDGTSWSLSTKSIYLEDSVTITDFSDWTFGYLDGNGVINTTSYVKYNYLKVSSGQTITVNTCGASITIAKENNKALVTANKANNVLGTYSYTPIETCNLYVAVRVANAANQGTLIPPSITISSIVPPYMKKENVVPFGEGEEYNDVVSALSLKNKSIITEEDAKWINGWMARNHPWSGGNASMFLFENDSYSYIYAKVKGYNQPTYWAIAFYSGSPSDDTLIKSFAFNSLPYENEWYIIKEEIPENCKYIYVHAGGAGLANVTSKVHIFRKDSYLSLKDLLDNFQIVKDTTILDGINFVPSMYDNYGRYIQIRNHIGKKKNVWNATATNSDFRCIFMSDIHAQESTFRRIVGLTNLWYEEGYVDALINSGDVAYDLPTESYTWYNNLRNECAVDVLTTPGNHDYIYSNKGSKELCYSNIIAPMVNGTTISGEGGETVVGQVSGIIQPEDAADEHRLYYFKDYNSVRVIAIYMKVDATEQLAWLKEVLTDAITNSKHVIIINHAPFAAAIALREYATAAEFFENNPNTFYSSASMVPGYSSSGFSNSDTPISAAYVAAVKEFEDAGGNFICWLSGHCHSDAFYDVANHETYGYQLHLNTTCASNTMSSFDSVRVGSYGNRDSFNYLCVDTTKKVIEVLRIGNNTDIIGRSKIYFAYHYGLHKLIANY